MKQQIPEAVLWRPSREYLRRKSRDKKHQVNSPVSLASRLYSEMTKFIARVNRFSIV